MHTEAVFEDIATHIEHELSNAQSSIIIAVAWFTNKNLFKNCTDLNNYKIFIN